MKVFLVEDEYIDVIRNMIVVTLGNIVGGAILLSGPLKLMSYDH